jgi:tetratricopeptide (TPR) repeat protein
LSGHQKPRKESWGPDHLDVATNLNNLALLYYCEAKYAEAEPLYKRALEIRETNLGPDDPAVLQTMQFYAALLRQQGRKTEAHAVDAQTAFKGIAHL